MKRLKYLMKILYKNISLYSLKFKRLWKLAIPVNVEEEYMKEDSSHRQSSVVVTLTKILEN